MIRLLLFFVGVRKLRIRSAFAGELMNLCRRGGYVYRNLKFCGDQVCLEASFATSRKILSACADRGIAVVVESERGLPAVFCRYRHRYGIALGLVCFLWMIAWSGRVLWSIEIDGNRTLSDAKVKEALSVCGMSVGMPLSRLDTAVMENRVLIYSDDISWISINMVGTVAHVELREVVLSSPESEYAASNLVAERSGVIVGFEQVRGNVAVQVGDVVTEGDLLVGGLYDIEGGGYRYRRAEGRVLAKTEREFSLEIPLSYEEKRYTGREKCEKYLIFFEKEVKFFGNSGNLYATCDKIDTVEYFGFSEDRLLPIGIRTVRYLEYEICLEARDEAMARELAYRQLREEMERSVPEGQLLSKRLTPLLTENAFILRCHAEYIEDIAIVKEIEIEGISR